MKPVRLAVMIAIILTLVVVVLAAVHILLHGYETPPQRLDRAMLGQGNMVENKTMKFTVYGVEESLPISDVRCALRVDGDNYGRFSSLCLSIDCEIMDASGYAYHIAVADNNGNGILDIGDDLILASDTGLLNHGTYDLLVTSRCLVS